MTLNPLPETPARKKAKTVKRYTDEFFERVVAQGKIQKKRRLPEPLNPISSKQRHKQFNTQDPEGQIKKMMTTISDFSNAYFCVRQNEKRDVLIVFLVKAVIPAKAWNELRNKICEDTTISDNTTVYFDYLIINGEVDRFCYVTIGDWRKLGFSGNNIKNCIPSAPKEIIEEGNRYFYYNDEMLKHGLLCGRKLERIQQMIFKQIFATEMKSLAENYRKNFKEVGMTDSDIDNWFDQTTREIYHTEA